MAFLRRGGGERGASLVEFAILLPVFMTLVLGMFSGGIAYNTQLSLRHAAREGARYGSVLPRSPGTVSTKTWANRVRDVVVARSEGELTAADVCVALVSGTTGDVVLPTATYSSKADGSRCYDDGNGDPDARVQVGVTGTSKLEALVFSWDLSLSAEATAKHEGS